MIINMMKDVRCVFAVSLVIVSFMGLVSCVNSSQHIENSENGIKYDTISLERTYNLDQREDYPSCNLKINVLFPVESELYNIDNIKQILQSSLIGYEYDGITFDDAIEKYAENYIESYKKDADIFRNNRPKEDYGEQFDDIFHNDGYHSTLPDIFYSYYESIENAIVFDHYGVLSFQVKQNNSKGGEVSTETVRNYAIDLASGKLIEEEDIFVAGYDIALRPIIQNCLFQQYGVKSVEDLEDLGFFGIDEIIPNKNFLITDSGIIYTFNKGEYSAYQLPSSEIFMPYDYIKSILRQNSAAYKLSNIE